MKFGTTKKFILFLHGWGADSTSFLWLKDYFEDDYSLLFLDFSGFGKSEIPTKAMNVSDYVLEVKKLLDNFEIESLNIVAHSFGGRVAIKFMFYFQSFYKSVSLCLVDSAGILPRKSLICKARIRRYRFLKKKAVSNKRIGEKLLKFGSGDYKILCPVMKQTFVNVVNEDLACYAKFVACKTLIVWGNKDKDTKLFMAKKLKRLIKNSRLVVFKNCGHFCFLEKKEEFVYTLDTFLKNL